MQKQCRDCSKCTERGLWAFVKRLLNLVLVICTLGLSVVISKMSRGSRQLCPICKHPLTWHSVVEGRFKD